MALTATGNAPAGGCSTATFSSSRIHFLFNSNLQFSRLPRRSHDQPSPFLQLRTKRLIHFLPHSTSPRVTTTPEEGTSPFLDVDPRKEFARLDSLRSRLKKARSVDEKVRILDSDSRVKRVAQSAMLKNLKIGEVFLVKCLVAAGQGHVVGWGAEGEKDIHVEKSGLRSALGVLAGIVEKWELSGGMKGTGVRYMAEGEGDDLKGLLRVLEDVERFYDSIGGILGYQIMVLGFLYPSKMVRQSVSHYHDKSMKKELVEFHVPKGVNLLEDKEYASQAALWGIEGLPRLGEIYALGGAGDRLGLIDHNTGECLPAAMLLYCGRTLLEGLIRDLQAREFLYFKIYGEQCITPVAIMTSSVKNNHEHITTLCQNLKWFGRGCNSFQLFEQPLVPVISAEDGQWLMSKPFTPIFKPGGHGAIWKLAHDKGVFKWFYGHGRKGATIRQVSNVVAATDVTLLALAGFGLHHKKKLGFASCERNSAATEGINVLVEKRNALGQWEYRITCIEYTEFEMFGIKNASASTNSLRSDFPANTNILYVDLPSAEKIGSCKDITCLPGIVLNRKKTLPFVDHFGIPHSVSGGRLECTMQSIADNFANAYPSRCYKSIEEKLDTFIVYNERKRVTSSAKRKRKHNDKYLNQTPDGSLLDIIRNATDILSHCNINIPKIGDNSNYINSRPPFLIFLHPALGPMWEVTRQKFYGGSISADSELQLEVVEFLWENVQLDGSLIVFAKNPMGSTRTFTNGDPLIQYGYRCGRCKLQNIMVLNKGIDWDSKNNIYWKHDVRRIETLKIILQGNAEFEATNVTFKGNHVFEVPNGFRMIIIPCNISVSGFSSKLEPIRKELMDIGSWFWSYKIEGTHIKLEMMES